MSRRDPEAVTTDATVATLAVEVPDPLVVLGVFAVWVLSGLLVARYMADRGHDFRTVAGLAAATGPLFLPLALDHLRRRDPATDPVVLTGDLTPGHRTVVLLAGEPERAADVRPVLRRFEDPGTVVLAVPVGFSTLRAPEHDEQRREAEARARQAALLLHDLDPVTVLAPGTPAHVVDRLALSVDDVVLVVGATDPEETASDRVRPAVLRVPTDGGR